MSSPFYSSGAPAAAPAPAPNGSANVAPNGSGSASNGSTGNGDSAPHWASTFQDKDLGAWTAKQNWSGPETLAKSYRDLQRHMSDSRTLVLPEKPDDADGWGKVYDRLGRPKDAKEYELPEFKRAGYPLGNDFRTWAHEAGLSAAQAKRLGTSYDALTERLWNEAETRYQEDGSTTERKLRAEWGEAWDEKGAAMERARERTGFSAEDILALRRAVGSEKIMRLFASLGETMAEDRGSPMDSSSVVPGLSGKEKAERDRREKMADPEFQKAIIRGDPKAVREMREMTDAVYGNEVLRGPRDRR